MKSVGKDVGLSVFLAVLIVASAVPVASAGAVGDAQSAQQDGPMTDDDDGIDPADDIYVRENGDVVLVYEEERDDADESTGSGFGPSGEAAAAASASNVEYGANISSNLLYFLATEPVEEDTDVRGQASVLLTDSNITGDGAVSFSQPESLESLSFELAGESTAENAESSVALDAEFDNEESAAGQQFESASTSGNVTVTGSSYVADGSVDAQFTPSAASQTPESASFTLTEDDGDYTIDVEQNRTVYTYTAEDWNTRENAAATLEEQYGAAAEQYGGTADITIDRYAYTEGEGRNSDRLDIAYTVEYTDIESGITDQITQSLTESEDVDISEARAEELGTQMENLSVNRISTSYEVGSESASADFEVDIDNYDDAVLAGLEIAESADTEEFDGSSLQNIDRVRNQIEAQQASDLEQEFTWDGTVSQPDSETLAVSFEANYTTENWDAYVEELDARGIDSYDTSYQVDATTTDDDRVNVTGSMTVDGDVYDQYMAQLMNATEEDTETNRLLTAFLQADLQRSRLNVSSDEETARVEFGAQFENMSAIRDALAENGTVPGGMTEVVGRTDGNTTSTYVRVTGAVGENASESEVRELAYVDEDTTVHLPGEWDREFPSMDTERAASFLGVSLPSNNSEAAQTSSGSGPGFTVTGAVVALVAAALLVRRRD